MVLADVDFKQRVFMSLFYAFSAVITLALNRISAAGTKFYNPHSLHSRRLFATERSALILSTISHLIRSTMPILSRLASSSATSSCSARATRLFSATEASTSLVARRRDLALPGLYTKIRRSILWTTLFRRLTLTFVTKSSKTSTLAH